ncbi:Tim44 domain-containing protein [Sulfurisoma sediminicola]|uniref:Putative lipid-binding transport protein (Tim44 family) n=1 Tax=Sulfurisoma sediminicola TaxID=1381557 RepID=A0A497XJP2_9PROT|nr:Tim44-like domain-containing protein [Sulfurisoma sediminicola]RLJ68172.1 putative lipid-binding transport protein (Tim44 family) [Sulfurisoma sediminicola]
MKRLYLALFAAFIGLGLTVQDAEAKRLGGGGSFGMKRDSTVMKRDAAPAAPAAPTQGSAAAAKPATPATPPATQPSGMRKWLGPIAGLAAGLGIAALLSHFGLGEGMATMLMILLGVVAVVFVVKLLLRKSQPQSGMRYAGAGAQGDMGRVEPAHFEPASAASVGAGGTAASIPVGFDVEGFLRQAKLNYIRLQAANDRGDMDDIRNFTSPEMFAEIQMQYEERGRGKQETDVQQLDATLLDVSEENGRHVASVRFFGRIREVAGGPVEALDEVWHLSKQVDGSGGWVIAGIQQFQ